MELCDSINFTNKANWNTWFKGRAISINYFENYFIEYITIWPQRRLSALVQAILVDFLNCTLDYKYLPVTFLANTRFFLLTKTHFKISSAKCRPFRSDFNEFFHGGLVMSYSNLGQGQHSNYVVLSSNVFCGIRLRGFRNKCSCS